MCLYYFAKESEETTNRNETYKQIKLKKKNVKLKINRFSAAIQKKNSKIKRKI